MKLTESKGFKRIAGMAIITVAVIGKAAGAFELEQVAAISKLIESVTGVGLFTALVTFGATLAGIGVAHAMSAGNMKGLINLFKGNKGAVSLKQLGAGAVLLAGLVGGDIAENQMVADKAIDEMQAKIDSVEAAERAVDSVADFKSDSINAANLPEGVKYASVRPDGNHKQSNKFNELYYYSPEEFAIVRTYRGKGKDTTFVSEQFVEADKRWLLAVKAEAVMENPPITVDAGEVVEEIGVEEISGTR